MSARSTHATDVLASARRQLFGLAAGAVASSVVYRVLLRLGPQPAADPHDQSADVQSRGWPGAFWRRNFAAEPVSLYAGPASVAGLVVGCLVAGRPESAALAVATGGVGLLDDLAGSSDSRGLAGHLRAATRGDVTTGGIKVIGLTAAATMLAVWRRRGPASVTAGVVDTALDTALVAGTANLVNLFDLRPGRATKAAVLIGGLFGTAAVPNTAGPVLGALAGTVGDDLGGRSMLGDCGANAAGAVLAAGFTASAARPARLVALAGVTALTLFSEKVSFSRVIDTTPWLRRLDRWGRRPGG